MRIFNVIFLCLMLAMAVEAKEQKVLPATTLSETHKQLPMQYAGTMMPYDFSGVQTHPVWADSLKPVYLAHIARHGARYITSEKKLDNLRKEIAKSNSVDGLTPLGKRFEVLLDSVAARSRGQWGLLSAVGIAEEMKIANNLTTLLPDLLKTARVNAISTYVPRVVMTMYQFCHQLTRSSSHVEITASEGRQYSRLLRCFSADSLYDAYRNDGDWQVIYDRHLLSDISSAPAERILGKNSGLDDKRLKEFTMDIYDILQSLAAFGMDPASDEYMTASEYRECWMLDNFHHYLRNTITLWNDLAAQATAPLLDKIITDADKSLCLLAEGNSPMSPRSNTVASTDENTRISANLYFGHAETLMPLLSLMDVDGCHPQADDPASLAEQWRDSEIVPLGAHLDMILLQAPSGKIMVALQLNGKFLPPMPHQSKALVADWDIYRRFLLSRLDK